MGITGGTRNADGFAERFLRRLGKDECGIYGGIVVFGCDTI